jgi:APA family basic amino acid/polyamine antiporter
LPQTFSRISPRFGTPIRTSVLTGVVVAVLAFFFSLGTLAELVNIGTLFAFVLVSIGVMVLRRKQPDLRRVFHTPAVYVTGTLSVLASVYLMLNLPAATWLRFVIWMALGLVVYFGYGYRASTLHRAEPGRVTTP